MDTRLLCEWLTMPPGDWPPPPRELLGLAAAAPREAAQSAALARMALLRPHQLAHPELVTEGMNRLAQAVIAVESASPAAAPVHDLAPEEGITPRPAPGARRAVRVRVTPPLPVAKPTAPLPAAEAEPLTLVAEVPPPPPGLGREARREFYRELAALRALVRALDAARPTAADPGEPLTSLVAATRAAEAVGQLRAALLRDGLPPDATANGPCLVAICRAPQPVGVLRSLTPDQRGRVAREWAATRAWAAGRQDSLRAALRARPRFPIIAPRPRAAGLPARAVVALTILAGLVALARFARA